MQVLGVKRVRVAVDSRQGAALPEGGFGVDILSSGEEALTLFKARIKDYRALVTDVNLKGHLSGWEVAKQVREINPAFPVIYRTGAAAGQWPSHGVPNSILLEKPFAPAQLLTAVSNLLNAGGPSIATEDEAPDSDSALCQLQELLHRNRHVMVLGKSSA